MRDDDIYTLRAIVATSIYTLAFVTKSYSSTVGRQGFLGYCAHGEAFVPMGRPCEAHESPPEPTSPTSSTIAHLFCVKPIVHPLSLSLRRASLFAGLLLWLQAHCLLSHSLHRASHFDC